MAISAMALAAKELPPVEWIIEDVLPNGFALLAGAPKIGKSWSAMDIAVNVARGTPAFGSLPTQRKKVLYMALEDALSRLQRRLHAFQAAPEGLDFMTSEDWHYGFGQGLQELRKLIDQEGYELIIIDVLETFRGGDRQGYKAEYGSTRELKRIADDFAVGILAVHHDTKSKQKDPIHRIAGSLGLTGGVDTIFYMQAHQRGSGRVEFTMTGRDVEDQSLLLRREGPQWQIDTATEEEATISVARQEMLDLLGVETLAPKDIAEALGKTQGATRKLLFDMKQDGQLVRLADGRYTVPEVQTDEVPSNAVTGNEAGDCPPGNNSTDVLQYMCAATCD